MADATRESLAHAPVATPLRERLPRLSHAHAEALRLLFGAPLRWPLRDGALRLRPGVRAEHAIALDADGDRLALAFAPGTPCAELHNGLRWSDHRGRARVLAWALAHEPALVRLSEALGAALLPLADEDLAQAAAADAAAEREALWLRFEVEGGAPLSGALRVPLAWAPRLAERAERVAAENARWSALPLPARVALPGPALDASQWRALRPGDVLVVGPRARLQRAELRMHGRLWPLARDAAGWRVDGAGQPFFPSQEIPVSSDVAPTAPSAETASVPDVPVRIEFEVGSLELTLDALGALQPGYVFALPAPAEGANVVLRANGKVAGRGELVAVGDTLGVRLLSWS